MTNSLYVTVTEECEFVADIFPKNVVWEMTDEELNDDGTSVIRFEWNGDLCNEIEENIKSFPGIIGYQIL